MNRYTADTKLAERMIKYKIHRRRKESPMAPPTYMTKRLEDAICLALWYKPKVKKPKMQHRTKVMAMMTDWYAMARSRVSCSCDAYDTGTRPMHGEDPDVFAIWCEKEMSKVLKNWN